MDSAVDNDQPDEMAAHVVRAHQDDADVEAVEQHAEGGCSRCARMLVNAREQAVSLALSAQAIANRAYLRARVLESARYRMVGVQERGKGRRFHDPSSTVAHLHIGGAGDEARTGEVDSLDAMNERAGDGMGRVLMQLARMTNFPLLFVSVIRGGWVGYRAQHGLGFAFGDRPQMRREMTYCTHCVSTEAPFVVEDASGEPFFRGSKMVTRYGIRAYVGVPLRTSTGIVIGTLCALDVARRQKDKAVVELLQLFSEPVVAEMEVGRGVARRDAILERLSDGSEIYAAAWFSRLLEIEHARAVKGRPVALVGFRGVDVRVATEAAGANDVVGRLADGTLGLLLSGASDAQAAARCAAIRLAAPQARYVLGQKSPNAHVWQVHAMQ